MMHFKKKKKKTYSYQQNDLPEGPTCRRCDPFPAAECVPVRDAIHRRSGGRERR